MSIITVLFAFLFIFAKRNSLADDDHPSSSCGCSGAGLTRDFSGYFDTIQNSELSNKRVESCSAVSSGIEDEKMVLVKGAKFLLGTDDPQIPYDGEAPRREANISTFYMDKYPVRILFKTLSVMNLIRVLGFK